MIMVHFNRKTMKNFCTVVSVLIMSVMIPTTSAGERPLEPGDYFNLEFLSDTQISPDGSRVVYVRQFMDIMTDKRYSNLWLINFDGTGHRPLTSGLHNDSSPRWSPDGQEIIYVSNRGGNAQIHKIYVRTAESVVLTNLLTGPSGITWSPDGKHIAFSSFVPSEPKSFVRLPAPPGAKWAQPPIIIDRLVYRFDSVGYLKGYSQLYVMSANGGTPRKLSSGDFNHSGPIAWTPNNTHILISANRREDHEIELRDSEIYAFSISDGTIKALTDRRGPDSSPQVSPDGKLIAYTGYDDRYQGFQLTKLYTMNRNGSSNREILPDLDHSIRNIAWAADGKGLFFAYDDKGNTKLAHTTLDGTITTIAHNMGARGLLGSYSGSESYSVAKNGNFAYTVTRPDLPVDVAVGNIKNPEIKVITAINADILPEISLAAVEEIWYDSSLDGRPVQGWIMKPPGFDPTQKYPLILEIHGGPFANYGDRFDTEKQFMASAGYVVLYTNPRGSTSYGEEFGNLIHHAYPGDDFYDLDSGVETLIGKGYIDPDNVFVTGGSGGGVLTCWMIGRSSRFRAAVPIYPVINWYSWVLTADIGNMGVKYWFPGFPWDNAEHYESRSLLSVVKNVSCPTMIITGEEDWRCPMSESEQYYQALKLRDIKAVLVRIPDEPHGILIRPSHHLSKIQHITAWFDRHKKR
jgi:acylaminoacyl-peptidase